MSASGSLEKARVQRLQRLKTMLESRLDQPPAAIEALISELEAGESQAELWEQLHAAAIRDQMEKALGEAYAKITSSQRVQRLEARAKAEVLLHAADYFQGILGDVPAAEAFLEKVATIVPGHPDAFARLERRVEAAADPRRALELYASAAAAPPIAANTLAVKAEHRLVLLPAKSPLADEACKRLVALVPVYPKLLHALEGHCRLTQRPALACALIEAALQTEGFPEAMVEGERRRVIDLYLADPNTAAGAMPHVEDLLHRDPTDPAARKAAERLLSTREVASRAAAALQVARRSILPPRM